LIRHAASTAAAVPTAAAAAAGHQSAALLFVSLSWSPRFGERRVANPNQYFIVD